MTRAELMEEMWIRYRSAFREWMTAEKRQDSALAAAAARAYKEARDALFQEMLEYRRLGRSRESCA